MGMCLPCLNSSVEDYDDTDPETRRKQQAEAAERRLKENEGRGVKDPEGLKKKQQRKEEMEKRADRQDSEGGLRYSHRGWIIWAKCPREENYPSAVAVLYKLDKHVLDGFYGDIVHVHGRTCSVMRNCESDFSWFDVLEHDDVIGRLDEDIGLMKEMYNFKMPS